MFGLAELEDNSKFINSSRPEDVEFFVKSTRNLLFGFENINLEEFANRKFDNSSEESELSFCMKNIAIAIGGGYDSDINEMKKL